MIGADESLSSADFQQLASLHADSLESSILSCLGLKVLEHYYRFAAASPTEYIFVVRSDSGKIIGGCVLSFQPGSITKRAVKKNVVLIALAMCQKVLVSHATRKAIFDFLFRKSPPPSVVAGLPEIIQIFASADHRNMNIGTRLITMAEALLASKNYHKYFMKTVASKDNQALFFYRKRGFTEVARSESGGKEYCYFTKECSRTEERTKTSKASVI